MPHPTPGAPPSSRRWRAIALAILGLYVPLLIAAWVSYALRGDFGISPGPDASGLIIISVAPGSPGERAGLQTGDRILSVNGSPTRDTDAFLWPAFGPGPAGGSELLRVQHVTTGSSGNTYPPATEVTLYRQALIDQPDYLVRILTFTITGVFNLGVGVLVALARPNDIAARLAMIMGSAIAFSIVAAPLSDVYHQFWFDRSIYLLGLLACSGLLHFFLLFPAVHPVLAGLRAIGPVWLRRLGGATVALYVVPFTVTAVLAADPASATANYSYVLAALMMTLVLLLIVRSYRNPPSPLARAQLKWILWAVAIGLIGWTGGAVVPQATTTGVTNLSLAAGIVTWSLLPIAIGFAVLRYRLFDVDRVIRATILYAVLTGLLVLGYVALAFLASLAALAITGDRATNRAVDVLIALVVAAIAHPARLRLQALLDQTIYRDRLRRRLFLDEATAQLGQIRSPAYVTHFLTQHAASRLDLTGAWVLLPTSLRAPLAIDSDGLPEAAAPVLSLLGDASQPMLLSDEALGDSPLPLLPASLPALTAWYRMGARLLVPLRADATDPGQPDHGAGQPAGPIGLVESAVPNDLLGIWAISARKSQDLFDRDDLAVFAHVGQQASVLFDHARLQHEQIEHELTLRELARARDIQQRLLPTALPNWPGALEIAARFHSAQEMSGDFYDVVALRTSGRLDPLRPPLQVAIGDVAGKSIPAALVMAQAQTALRAGAQRPLDGPTGGDGEDIAPGPPYPPARTLRLANTILHTSAGYRQFVACALALVEPRGQGARMRLANAGQAPPLLCRADVTELVPEGERLPLGVLPDPRYTELQIDLFPGDVVIFTTDGLPEAPAPPRPIVHCRDAAASARLAPPVAPGEFFGFGRLAVSAAYWAVHGGSAEAVADGIWRDVIAWSGPVPRHDDMTLIVLRLSSSPRVQGEACQHG